MKILLVSTPAPAVKQTAVEKNYWKWHYALKTKLTYSNLSKKELIELGNAENQNVGLLSIASVLEKKGHKVFYLAPKPENVPIQEREKLFYKKLLELSKKENPQMICFSAHTCAIPVAKSYAKLAKSINPKIVTILGGPHASGAGGKDLEDLLSAFDFVVKGKGELPIAMLAEALENKHSINYIPGICYRKGSKVIAKEPAMTGFSDYPHPANELLNVKTLPAARIFTSLGCRRNGSCVFCADTIHNKGFAERPIAEAINEIKYLHKNFKTKYIYFGDENFFFDKERALNAINKINKLRLDIVVGYQVRLESTDEEIIKKVAESKKCTEIQYGVESASQEILNLNRKGLRYKKVREICKLTKKYGINAHCYFLVGLPGETKETAELTINEMCSLLESGLVDFVEYRIVVPFPGAQMYDNAKEFGIKILHKNWELYRGENFPQYELNYLSGKEIYNFYQKGLKKIAEIYKKRYLERFGKELPKINILSAVIEGGF
ncbi:MAG: B12-binding domain-containing radical SAM protein [Candidatus Diapherotrites archaeon]|nr:B12-binding domain-containing radical SAM protein [Candidatus Diapherotrites archaeon]